MLSNLNSLHSTIKDLKEIVDKNQGSNNETILLVKQMEQLIHEIERKARDSKKPMVEMSIPPMVQSVHVV